MEIKEFAELVKVGMESITGVDVEIREVQKNNGVVFCGLIVKEEGCNIHPTIYLEQYLEAYEKGTDMAEILNHIKVIVSAHKNVASLDMDWFRDWERVKGKVAYRLINFEANKELLKDIPYESFLDLAKVYYINIEDASIGSGTVLINNSHLDIWGVTPEQLGEIAVENTPKLFPALIRSLSDVLEEMMGIEDSITGEIDCKMFIISNEYKHYGASTFCYDNVIKEFAEKMNSDLFILPSSLHEVIVILSNDKGDMARLKSMVYEVNRTQLAEEDILSDSVYYYSREEDTIITF